VRRTGDDTVRVGITDYAQSALGDVVYTDLPAVGTEVEAGSEFGNVESTKSTSELYAPLTAKVVAVNEDLVDAPEQINAEPYGAGWLVDLQVDAASLDDALASLLDADGYRATLDE
jgi:glycine cleavage system H protein